MGRLRGIGRATLCWMAAAVVTAVSGCGPDTSWKASTHPTSGTISINGSSPENAILMLYTTGEPFDKRNAQPWAMVQADGSFEFTTYEERGDGVPEGEYRVVLYWPKTSTGSGDRLNGAYMIRDKPFLTVKVVPGPNKLPPIVLKDVNVSPAAAESGNGLGI